MQKMRNIAAIFLLMALPFFVSGSDGSGLEGKNAVTIELMGIGGFGSFNYEHTLFSVHAFHLDGRIGLSTIHIIDYRRKLNPDLLIPFMVSASYGHRHRAEAGFAESFSAVVKAGEKGQPYRKLEFNPSLYLGYRFQPSPSGIFFRIAYTPMLNYNYRFHYWGAVSIGYSFSWYEEADNHITVTYLPAFCLQQGRV